MSQEYVVEQISGYRIAQDGTPQWLVSWEAEPGKAQEQTWEPKEYVKHIDLWKQFETARQQPNEIASPVSKPTNTTSAASKKKPRQQSWQHQTKKATIIRALSTKPRLLPQKRPAALPLPASRITHKKQKHCNVTSGNSQFVATTPIVTRQPAVVSYTVTDLTKPRSSTKRKATAQRHKAPQHCKKKKTKDRNNRAVSIGMIPKCLSEAGFCQELKKTYNIVVEWHAAFTDMADNRFQFCNKMIFEKAGSRKFLLCSAKHYKLVMCGVKLTVEKYDPTVVNVIDLCACDDDKRKHKKPKSRAKSKVVALLPNKADSAPWEFTLCVEESMNTTSARAGDLVEMVLVRAESTLNDEYRCNQMVWYQRTSKHARCCTYLRNCAEVELASADSELVEMRWTSNSTDRSAEQIELFAHQLNTRNAVFVSPTVFHKTYVIGIKLLTVKRSLSNGDQYLVAQIVKLNINDCKPYRMSENTDK